jgi:two-component sensor histidine kinase
MVAEEVVVNIDDSPIVILAISDDDDILFFNKAAEKLFGNIGVGMKFSSFYHSDPVPDILNHSTAVKLTLDKGADLKMLRSSNGNPVYASVFYAPAKNNSRSIFIRDISSQVKYIAQVKQQLESGSELQKSSHIRNGNLEEALHEIAFLASKTMEVTRMNIWKFDEGFTSIRSLVSYDKNQGGFTENITLYRYELPNYFNLMQTEEMIVTDDAMNNPRTVEIRENYLVPFGILSMLDIPIRIEGKMVGVACFEDTQQVRYWNVSEQNFAVSVAQIIAQTLETHRRQEIQQDLEHALAEKKVLLAEINHRVKNNFSLISDLIRLQEVKAKDEFHKQLFADIRARLLSMTMIHRQLYLTDNFGAVNFRDFLLDLAAHFRTTFTNDGIEISTLLDNCRLPMGKAVLCGLVINELLTNACRNSFGKKDKRLITLRMNAINETVSISVSENGSSERTDEMSHDLIKELVEQLKGSFEHSPIGSMTKVLSFSIN